MPASSIALDRGDRVVIVGESDAFYEVVYSEGDVRKDPLLIGRDDARLHVDKRFVRPDDQPAPDAWDGYARPGSSVYASALMTGDPLRTLEANEQVRVLDSYGDYAFVQLADGMQGYAALEAVGSEPIEEQVESPVYFEETYIRAKAMSPRMTTTRSACTFGG